MPKIGKLRCGCDCKNQTELVEQGYVGTGTALADAPCCDAYPNGTPCRYAIIFECGHDWPLMVQSSCLTGGTEIGGLIYVPYGVLLNENLEGLCQAPTPLGLTFPVMEVLRDCPSDITGECIYTNRLYYNFIKPSGFETHMATSYLIDRGADAENIKFPPYRLNAGAVEYTKARYGRGFADPNRGPDIDDDACYHPYDLGFEYSTLWELKIAASPVSLEWVYDDVLNAMPQFAETGTGSGPNPHRPRYEAVDTWNLWGRNTMVLTNPEDWPALPKSICVVPESYGGIVNQCTSHEQQCTCCDIGEATGVIWPTITGCDKLNGTYTGVSQRYVDGDTLPPGVTMPGDAPCGFFWSLIGPDDECDISGTTWSSTIGLMTYCDGTTQHVVPYCYNVDTSQFVEQTEATVTVQECTCQGLYFEFELSSDLDCCCPPIVPACNCDETCLTVTYSSTVLTSFFDPPCVVPGRTVVLNGSPEGCAWSELPAFSSIFQVGVGPTTYFEMQISFQGSGCSFSPRYRRENSLGCVGVYTLSNHAGATGGLPATLTVSACP